MEKEALKAYLADAPPAVVPLKIKLHFDALTDRERRYAHHISRSALSKMPLVYDHTLMILQGVIPWYPDHPSTSLA